MPLRHGSTICTMLAALLVTLGSSLNAEEYYNGGCTGGCTDSGCTDGCTDGGCDTGCGCTSSCDSCCGKKHSWRLGGCGKGCFGGKGCRGKYYEGLDPHFNCGCNGSYNFPVPPLSTYMWPGMYKHQLMTEYDNPWRFPPIKAYTDEPGDIIPEDFRKVYPAKEMPEIIELEEDITVIRPRSTVQPVSHAREFPSRRYAGYETMSQKMERYYSSRK